MKTIDMGEVLRALTAAGVDAVIDGNTLWATRVDPATDRVVGFAAVGPFSLDEETDEMVASFTALKMKCSDPSRDGALLRERPGSLPTKATNALVADLMIAAVAK